MDENKTIEQYKADEIELKRQLEEAKAENQRLELEMKFKDKMTGLWNRKYIEKITEDGEVDAAKPGFTVVCADIDNLNVVNEKSGVDAGDALFKSAADGLQKSFGKDAVCCKLNGTKMCVFLTATLKELNEKFKSLDEFVESLKDLNHDIDFNYGFVRNEENSGKDAGSLLKEAEYALQMHKISNESDSTPGGRKKRERGEEITILMIDDSLVNLRTVQMMLKDNYKILMTTSGMEGFDIARTKSPDLILLDYNMPVLDGPKIMELLKKSKLTKDIPVIFVSGVSEKEKILKVASLKPAGYLLKPVEKENLLSVINSVLQS